MVEGVRPAASPAVAHLAVRAVRVRQTPEDRFYQRDRNSSERALAHLLAMTPGLTALAQRIRADAGNDGQKKPGRESPGATTTRGEW
jgi:hypothetical protein